MSKTFHAALLSSNPSAYKCADDFSWRELFTSIFPDNTAAYVASLTKTSVGAAEHVLRGRNGVSGRALVNLLRSPAGPKVLDAIAGDAEWRALERRLIDIVELERELQVLQLKRSELARKIEAPITRIHP